MKSLRVPLFVAALATACSGFAARSGIPPTILAYYAKSDRLTLKKDAPGLAKLMTENLTADYMYTGLADKAGKVSTIKRAQFIQGIAEVMTHIDFFSKAVTHIDRVIVGKTAALVTISSVVEMTTKLQPDGKVHKLVTHSKVDTTWLKVGSTWKLKLSKVLSGDATIDGKANR